MRCPSSRRPQPPKEGAPHPRTLRRLRNRRGASPHIEGSDGPLRPPSSTSGRDDGIGGPRLYVGAQREFCQGRAAAASTASWTAACPGFARDSPDAPLSPTRASNRREWGLPPQILGELDGVL